MREREREIEREGWTDGQSARETDRQTVRETHSHRDTETEAERERQAYRQLNFCQSIKGTRERADITAGSMVETLFARKGPLNYFDTNCFFTQ